MNKIYSSEKLRFVVAGIGNTLVGLLTYPALYLALNPLGLGYIKVLLLSQIVCITFAFVTNKMFVFRTKGSIAAEYMKFISFHAVYLIANILVLPLMVSLAELNPILGQTIFASAVIVSSYFWHSRITFSKG